jgi:uncharacterized protein YndB with AHSA1/START domain
VEQWPYILMGVGILALVLVGIAVAGSFMPRTHAVFRSLDSKQSPETLWALIRDFQSTPSWHPELKQVERLPDQNGHEVWRETYRGGYPVQLETLEATAPHRLVRRISDEKGPFTGRWEFELQPVADGTKITITEYGEIANPFFRFMARVFMNPATYLEMYLKALAAKLGDSPTVGGAKP